MNKLLKNFINVFVIFIIFVKIIFLLCLIGEITFHHYHKYSPQSKYWDKTLKYWHERAEFTFTICISILLIFIFLPFKNNIVYITKEMSILFCIFGIIALIRAKWSFVFENKMYKKLVHIVKY